MKRINNTLFMIVAVFSAASFSAPLSAQHHDNRGHAHPASGRVAAVTHHDQVAVTEMHTFAEQRFHAVSAMPHTYGATDRWDHDWELRWADYETTVGVVRIYHAIHKQYDGVRYASSCSGGQTHCHGWTLIQ